MIQRYALHDIDRLRDYFGLIDGVPKGVKKRFNYVPSQRVPVVLLRDGAMTMEQMQWGFVSQGARDTNSIFRYKTFVISVDDIFKKPMWNNSVRTRRCLIPANGFYVWSQNSGDKIPYYVQSHPNPLMALAGVYSSWTDSEGRESGMVSIVTVPAGKSTDQYTDHQPVIVPPELRDDWLDPETTDSGSIYQVLQTLPFSSWKFTQVSDLIYSKKIDTTDLMRRV